MRLFLTSGLLLGAIALSQTSPSSDSTLRFDVASVKPMPPNPTAMYWALGPRPGSGGQPGTRVDISANLLSIIQTAYNLQPNQVKAEPKWVDSPEGNFDIVATPASPATTEQLRTMLRNLLADRFQLQVKIESKEVPAYALDLDKGGPKNLATSAPSLDANGQPTRGRGMTVAQFVKLMRVGPDGYNSTSATDYSSVEDRTGLTGAYDFFGGLGRNFLSPANPPGAYHPQGVDPETVSDLLSDTIGLKLTRIAISQPILTIVQVEKPAAQ